MEFCRPRIFDWPKKNDGDTSSRVLFFSGRIDNFSDFFPDGNAIPSDKEAVEIIYQQHGQECANLLLGDFVVALWDPNIRSVVCFRDICGCQVAFYTSNTKRFIISSDIAGILAEGSTLKSLNEPFVVSALSKIFDHREHTFQKHVFKIPPAHILTINADEKKVEPFWRPEDVPDIDFSDPSEVYERFRAILKQAVKDRLPTTGAVGVHASGGLDCSSVAIMATEMIRERGGDAPYAFAWQPAPKTPDVDSPDGTYHDLSPLEYEAIDALCESAGLEPIYCPTTKADILEALDRDDTVDRIGGATYSDWGVQREAAKRGVKTILTGFGGDQLASFNGAGYFQGLVLKGRFFKLWQLARNAGLNPIRFIGVHLGVGVQNRLLPISIFGRYYEEKNHGLPRWKAILRLIFCAPGSEFLMNAAEIQMAKPAASYVARDIAQAVEPIQARKKLHLTSARRTMRDLYHMGGLTYRMEAWANDGAKLGITYVYPLLDKRVVEFALGLPEHAFRDAKINRLFFRKAMEPVLPEKICWSLKFPEFARSGFAMKESKKALVEYGNLLRSGKLKLSRGKYVDLERLSADLTPEALDNRRGVAKLFFAIQFLGLEKK